MNFACKHTGGQLVFGTGSDKMKIFAIALVAALTLPVSAGAVNVVANAGFESGALGPWFNTAGGNWAATNTDAHSGGFSAIDTGNFEIRQDFAPVAVSALTTAQFWLKHPNLNGAPTYVTLTYSDNSNTGFVVSTGGSGWELINVLGNLDVSKSLSAFAIYGYSGGGGDDVTLLDDVLFDNGAAAVPEPATWALMIGGFALTGAAMRRRPLATA